MATTFIIVIYTRQAEGQILEKNLNGKKTVVIMGTTDIHGRVYPTPLFRSDTE